MDNDYDYSSICNYYHREKDISGQTIYLPSMEFYLEWNAIGWSNTSNIEIESVTLCNVDIPENINENKVEYFNPSSYKNYSGNIYPERFMLPEDGYNWAEGSEYIHYSQPQKDYNITNKKIYIPVGSYKVNHEYYFKDMDGNLILENTYSEDTVTDIEIGTTVGLENTNIIVNKIPISNDIEYKFTEASPDIIVEEDKINEITLKYSREEKYTAKLPNSGGSTWILYHVILFLLTGVSSFFIATTKRKD